MEDRGYIGPLDFVMLIYDECHNLTGNSPMARIQKLYLKLPQHIARPRVLGLTASFENGKVDNLEHKRVRVSGWQADSCMRTSPADVHSHACGHWQLQPRGCSWQHTLHGGKCVHVERPHVHTSSRVSWQSFTPPRPRADAFCTGQTCGAARVSRRLRSRWRWIRR